MSSIGSVSIGEVVLELKGIRKSFKQGKEDLEVLRSIDFRIFKGESVALIGPSGAGKSTLLNICGLLEGADTGDILLGGKVCKGLTDEERTTFRRDYIGFVYQNHNLLYVLQKYKRNFFHHGHILLQIVPVHLFLNINQVLL